VHGTFWRIHRHRSKAVLDRWVIQPPGWLQFGRKMQPSQLAVTQCDHSADIVRLRSDFDDRYFFGFGGGNGSLLGGVGFSGCSPGGGPGLGLSGPGEGTRGGGALVSVASPPPRDLLTLSHRCPPTRTDPPLPLVGIPVAGEALSLGFAGRERSPPETTQTVHTLALRMESISRVGDRIPRLV
jgi:hypothetical protein